MKRLCCSLALVGLAIVATSFNRLRGQGGEEQDTVAALLAEAAKLPQETEAGRMVADREMARSMIAYGQRTQTPELIILGVQVLAKNPVNPVNANDAKDDVKKQLADLVEQAVKIRADDAALLKFAERVLDSLDETTRGLASGPMRWDVTIAGHGGFYQLDPRLRYNAHEKAIVTARASNAVLGAVVRRLNQTKEIARSVGNDSVKVVWNAGIYTSDWDCRIYNLSQKPIRVRIETN